jgi:hypothetical protein
VLVGGIMFLKRIRESDNADDERKNTEQSAAINHNQE